MKCVAEKSSEDIKRPSVSFKILLKRKRDGSGEIKSYKACLMLCDKEDANNNEENFSPVSDSSIIRLILPFESQSGWHRTHFHFKNAFPKRMVEMPGIRGVTEACV